MVGLILLVLGTACGRTEQANEQRIAELLVKGAQMLSSAAVGAEGGYGPLYLYDTTWYPEDNISRIDTERFPDWATTQYEICVYWEGRYSTKHVNQHRTRENPSVHYDRFGTARGWILVAEDDVHYLELSLGYDDEDVTVIIDAWDPPTNSSGIGRHPSSGPKTESESTETSV